MKTKVCSLLIGLALSSGAFPHGTRGGETVDVNGVPVLRDLVEKTNCLWVPGPEMVRETPALETVLKQVALLDWYLAAELKAEISYLSYCKTSQLLKVDTRDGETLHRGAYLHTSQAAIRLNSDVYLDMSIFDRMDATNQAYLLIHEALHSYMDWDLEQRNQKLRSMVGTLQLVNSGLVSTRAQLHLQLEKNGIKFPLTVASLTAYRPQIEYMLASETRKQQILLTVRDLEAFMAKFKLINPELLMEGHAGLLKGSTNWDEKIRIACENDDVATFDFYSKFDPDTNKTFAICAMAKDLDDESVLSGRVLRHFRSGTFLRSLALEHSQAKVFSRGGRLYSRTPFSSFASNADRAVEPLVLLNLDAAILGKHLDPTFGGLAKFVAHELSQGQEAQVRDLVLEDPGFGKIFGATEILAEIRSLPLTYERETDLGLKKVPLLLQHFWDTFLTEVRAQSSMQNSEWMKSEINKKNLGYQL